MTTKPTKKPVPSKPPPPGKGTAQNVKMGQIRQTVGVGNPETRLVAKPMNALATTFKEAVDQATQHIALGLQGLTAAAAMQNLAPAELSKVHDMAAATMDAVDETKKIIRARVLEVVLAKGEVRGEKGLSRVLDLGNGMVQPITIQKTGTDPKKFEASLRVKGAIIAKYMDQVVSFKMKEGTGSQDLALADNVLTYDELQTLNYEPSYRVDRAKEAKS